MFELIILISLVFNICEFQHYILERKKENKIAGALTNLIKNVLFTF